MNTINWKSDSLNVIRAKQQLDEHKKQLEELNTKGKSCYSRGREYTERRINELTDFIIENE